MSALALGSDESDESDCDLFPTIDAAACAESSDDDVARAPKPRPRRAGAPVARVDACALTPEAFAASYAAPRVPVVLTGAAAGVAHMDADWWASNFGGMTVPLDVNSSDAVTANFGAFLRGETERSRYLRNLHLDDWFPGASAGVALPAVLGTSLLADDGRVPPAWRKWFELFICREECSGFPFLHRDVCRTHAYSLQIQGSKRFVVFPPTDEQYLYVSANRSTIPDVDADDVLENFPLLRLASPAAVVIGPGDCLFVPDGWWHVAKCASPDAPSITLGGNYATDDNRDRFFDAFADFQALKSLQAVGAATMR